MPEQALAALVQTLSEPELEQQGLEPVLAFPEQEQVLGQELALSAQDLERVPELVLGEQVPVQETVQGPELAQVLEPVLEKVLEPAQEQVPELVRVLAWVLESGQEQVPELELERGPELAQEQELVLAQGREPELGLESEQVQQAAHLPESASHPSLDQLQPACLGRLQVQVLRLAFLQVPEQAREPGQQAAHPEVSALRLLRGWWLQGS